MRLIAMHTRSDSNALLSQKLNKHTHNINCSEREIMWHRGQNCLLSSRLYNISLTLVKQRRSHKSHVRLMCVTYYYDGLNLLNPYFLYSDGSKHKQALAPLLRPDHAPNAAQILSHTSPVKRVAPRESRPLIRHALHLGQKLGPECIIFCETHKHANVLNGRCHHAVCRIVPEDQVAMSFR
jgi:hypothetical protein